MFYFVTDTENDEVSCNDNFDDVDFAIVMIDLVILMKTARGCFWLLLFFGKDNDADGSAILQIINKKTTS